MAKKSSMKVSELIGILDLIWEKYGDVDVWYYTVRHGYDPGGGPGLADTGGGPTFHTQMRRVYGAFPGTDDYRKEEVRAFISLANPSNIKKALEDRGRYLSRHDMVHVLELEKKEDPND